MRSTSTTPPLLRLLAINLAAGLTIAVLMVAGLMLLNPHNLRDLILADRNGILVAGLMLFGFAVTFGGCVMATAIMALGRPPD